MAPNKKKKKTPASNPARGFATTSTPAKPKFEEKVDDDVVPEKALVNSNAAPNTKNVGLKIANGDSEDLSKLSPEELENHLEESALQILIEKHGEKSKKDASRQVNKLRTEQRVLRLQSEHLDISSWLPQELVRSIFDLLKSQKRSRGFDLDVDIRQTKYNVSEQDLIIKLWTLRQVLTQLGFSDGRVQSAVLSQLQMGHLTRSSASSTSKDGLWGLEESLDFLAQVCEPEEMPSYDAQSASSQASKGRKILRSGMVPDSGIDFFCFNFLIRSPSTYA